MRQDDLANIEWLEPWHPSSPGLEIELEKEVGSCHPLHGIEAISVGRRDDQDDVLFLLPNNSQPLAVAHLTWKGAPELSPQWPRTTFYSSLDDWIQQCMKPDHLELTLG
jgi:hypothetical protein